MKVDVIMPGDHPVWIVWGRPFLLVSITVPGDGINQFLKYIFKNMFLSRGGRDAQETQIAISYGHLFFFVAIGFFPLRL